MIFCLGRFGLQCLSSNSSSSFQGRSLETFSAQAPVKKRRVGGCQVVCSNAWEQDGWYDYTELGVDTQDLNRQWDEFIGQQNRQSSNVPLQLLRMRMMGIEWQHRIKTCQLEKVYLIMFNTDTNSSQGVYSIQIMDNSILGANNQQNSGDENKASAIDLILSFECKDDAVRYAGLLEALMVTKPCVYSISPDELMDFCEKRGHICWLQPRGSFITPPEKNAKFTNWERDLLEQQMRQEISQYLRSVEEQKATENSSQLNTQLFWSRDEEDDEDLEEVNGWLENILHRS
eukprot:TRINITY_DN24939_c0_g2_i2.p1 TRINITY_DN24939_c0_g2~~TRINITY_DN24939_c0_g2_i2.p1  ORF type:complete len:288 (+),score=33.46 TRINITY_DN24939_c0_g2_i2:224-1087(+)